MRTHSTSLLPSLPGVIMSPDIEPSTRLCERSPFDNGTDKSNRIYSLSSWFHSSGPRWSFPKDSYCNASFKYYQALIFISCGVDTKLTNLDECCRNSECVGWRAEKFQKKDRASPPAFILSKYERPFDVSLDVDPSRVCAARIRTMGQL
jgi:hypothetical protein